MNVAPYINHWGGMTLKPGEDADNCLLFLSTYYVLRCLSGEHPSNLRYCGAVALCTLEPGLYTRRPEDRTSTNSFDDSVGIAAASVFMRLRFADEIYSKGEIWGWNFNNVQPGSWALWAWRQPSEIAYFKICAGRRPDLFGLAYLCIGLCITAFQGEKRTSEHLLTWLRVVAIEKAGLEPWARPWFALAAGIWRLGVQIRFGGMARVFSIYYADENHPNRLLAEQIYGKK